jgi:hypothetical protein
MKDRAFSELAVLCEALKKKKKGEAGSKKTL